MADLAAARDTDLTVLDDAGLAAFATAVAVEAKRREGSGSSPCADDLSDPDGEGSASARAKDSARGEIRLDLPASGAGAESGVAKTENADHLAGCLARLSSSEKGRLAAHDGEVASNAALLRPEAFRTWLARLLVRVADPADGDEGLSAAERAMAAAAWTMFRRPDGSRAVAASMDDERGTRMDAAVTARAREIADLRPSGQRTVTANDRARAAFELLCGVTLDASGGMWPGDAGRGGGGSGEAVGGGSWGSSPHGAPGADDGAGVSGTQQGSPVQNGTGAGGGGADDRVMGPNLAVGIIVDAATLVHGPHAGSVAETCAVPSTRPLRCGGVAAGPVCDVSDRSDHAVRTV